VKSRQLDPTLPRRYDFVPMPRKANAVRKNEALLQLRDAAIQLGVSFPTIKQWIYKKKIRSVQTAGGHHRIPQAELDRLLFRTRGKTAQERDDVLRRVSGRNQLVGRIEAVRISGLMAEIVISIGGQHITSIITSRSAREMQLKPGQTAAALIKATEVMILRV
jgi:molybdopterin-binding protein